MSQKRQASADLKSPKTPGKATRAESVTSPLAAAAVPRSTKVDPEVPIDPTSGKVYHLACSGNDIADRFIFVGDPGRVPTVAARFDKGSITFEGSHREIAIATGTYKGVPVTVLSTGMGTDNCEIVLNELHAVKDYNTETNTWSATPKKLRIIRVGTCGSPNPTMSIGTLAVTKYSIGMDNTCRFYEMPAGRHPPAVEKLERLVNTTTTLGKKVGVYASCAAKSVYEALIAAHAANAEVKQRRDVALGITASGSGFYGCQGRAVGQFRGALAVPQLVEELGAVELVEDDAAPPVRVNNIEMENSAITFLSTFLGYDAGTVCAVIAMRNGDKRAFATPEESKAAVADAITVGLDALVA